MSAKQIWQSELDSEIGFWDRWFETKGLEWPNDYRVRMDPTTPLGAHVTRFLPTGGTVPARILDVGAGPITCIGFDWPGHSVKITAVDPLADAYDAIMEKCGVVPPVRTSWCHGEMLSERFPQNSFDLVWAQNCVDHSYDPVRVIEQALRVVRIGGWVVLTHNTNEAVREGYAGLHQWNFCGENGSFVIWNQGSRQDVTARLSPWAKVRCTDNGSAVIVEIQKSAELPVADHPAPTARADSPHLDQNVVARANHWLAGRPLLRRALALVADRLLPPVQGPQG